MEALLILGAEFIGALAVLVVIGLELLASLLTFLFYLVCSPGERRPAEKRPRWSRKLTDGQRQRLRRYSRMAVRSMLGITAVSLLALVLVNYVFLDDTLEFLTRRIEARTGIAIRYGAMEGDLFKGTFTFEDVQAKQTTSDTAQFDVRVTRVAVTFSPWDFVLGRRTLETLLVHGATGSFTRLRNSEETPAIEAEPNRVNVRMAGRSRSGVSRSRTAPSPSKTGPGRRRSALPSTSSRSRPRRSAAPFFGSICCFAPI